MVVWRNICWSWLSARNHPVRICFLFVPKVCFPFTIHDLLFPLHSVASNHHDMLAFSNYKSKTTLHPLHFRSPLAIPGLFLLSLGLAGARQRSQGSLSLPIGLRTGILASSYVLQQGGFLVYKQKFPAWITGNSPFQPFSGVAGLAFSLLVAIILYPRKPFHKKKPRRPIRK